VLPVFSRLHEETTTCSDVTFTDASQPTLAVPLNPMSQVEMISLPISMYQNLAPSDYPATPLLLPSDQTKRLLEELEIARATEDLWVYLPILPRHGEIDCNGGAGSWCNTPWRVSLTKAQESGMQPVSQPIPCSRRPAFVGSLSALPAQGASSILQSSQPVALDVLAMTNLSTSKTFGGFDVQQPHIEQWRNLCRPMNAPEPKTALSDHHTHNSRDADRLVEKALQ
jgi:hypothetical protein